MSQASEAWPLLEDVVVRAPNDDGRGFDVWIRAGLDGGRGPTLKIEGVGVSQPEGEGTLRVTLRCDVDDPSYRATEAILVRVDLLVCATTWVGGCARLDGIFKQLLWRTEGQLREELAGGNAGSLPAGPIPEAWEMDLEGRARPMARGSLRVLPRQRFVAREP